MKVKDLMSTNITCINENTSVSQIAKQMRKENVGSLPVCDDNGHLKGIVTDRDLVLRVLAKYYTANPDPALELSVENRDISHMRSRDIMTLDPVTVSPDTNTHDAALLFSAHKVRRLPVVENSKIVGMLSLGDLAVKPICVDEAGDALSSISLPDGLQAKN
ncbi:MAG: CBS domain-containing protein [Bacillota bacterium]|nr:CBS domain-containing protein [Bacillota bacterium]